MRYCAQYLSLLTRILNIKEKCGNICQFIRYCVQYLRLLTRIVNIKENCGNICQFIRDTCLFTSRDMGYLVPHKQRKKGQRSGIDTIKYHT